MRGPVVITGGGTGGHIFPMQAVAEQLRAQGCRDDELRYVGSRRGQEATLLGDGGVALTLLPGRGIRRSLAPRAVVANVGAVAGLLIALVVATVQVGRWRPSVVVSLGGYAAFAVSFAAVLWRRPLVLVDFDAVAGSAHRVLGRFATRRCTTFPSNADGDIVTGVPLREAIVNLDRRAETRDAQLRAWSPPINPDRQVVVVMTGSLGSATVNRAVSDLAARWVQREDLALIHVTGRRDFDWVVRARPSGSALDYRVEAFADMSQLWGIADVAICRAGATTIGELTALGIASILVPLPGAPGDHQFHNAEVLARVGAARLVRDEECTAESLARTLDDLLEPARRAAMEVAARSLGRHDGAAAIARVVMTLRETP